MTETDWQNVPSYTESRSYYLWNYLRDYGPNFPNHYYRGAERWRALKSGADIGDLQPLAQGGPWLPYDLPPAPVLPGYPEDLEPLQYMPPPMLRPPVRAFPRVAPNPDAPYAPHRGPQRETYSPGRYTPQPRDRWLGREISVSIGPGTQTRTERDVPANRSRTRRKGKERKTTVRRLYGAAVNIWDKAGEIGDFVESWHNALPEHLQTDSDAIFDQAQAIADGFDQLDIQKAVENMIANEIEDAIVGRANKLGAQPIRGSGGPLAGVGVAI